MKNNFGPSNWNADEIQNVARDDPIQLPNTGGWDGGGGDSIILQNCFPQEVRPTCIIWGKFEKKVGKGLLITVKYTEILSRRWNQDSYCFLDLKV